MGKTKQAEPPPSEFRMGQTAVELAALLEKNKLGQFVKALSDEGYDYIEDVLTLPESEQHSLMQTVHMKPGHIRRLKRLLEEYVQDAGLPASINDSKGKDVKIKEEIKQVESQEVESKHPTPTLPAGKRWHYFASHKKLHSIHGPASEALAIRTKVL